LFVAAAGFGGIVVLQRLGVRVKLLYVLPAVVAWAGVYRAGVHPTIAGVLVGLMTPVRAWLGSDGFVTGVRHDLEKLEAAPAESLSTHSVAGVLKHVDVARREALSPAEALIEMLHPWVAFLIMPLFALANAGVLLEGSIDGASRLAASGIVAGLVVGKPVGVLLACALVLKLKWAKLPVGVGWRELVVLGGVAGVGFTMSLFVAQLAFSDPVLLAPAKLSVLLASVIAGLLSFVVGRALLPLDAAPGCAPTADEAEASTEL
jgi:NhaA family Na+:H+ antiporter